MIHLIIGGLAIFGLIQVVYWMYVIGRYEISPGDEDYHPRVSIIVAYHNEEPIIAQCIAALCEQDYAQLEIIAIDDHSTDGGHRSLSALAASHSHLVLMKNTGPQGKKQALAKAIAEATGEWIALTDADCMPDSTEWISVAMRYAGYSDVLLGYSPYMMRPGWLNRLIRYETLLIALQYIGLLSHGIRYMAVGRNLLFRKKTYEEHGGYDDHMDMVSGMDDLFVHGMRSGVRIMALTDPLTYVSSRPKESVGALYHQKIRHLSTSTRYDPCTQLVLIAISISQLGYYISIVFLMVYGYPLLGLLVLLARYLLVLWSLYRARRVLDHRISYACIPILDMMIAVYYISLSFTYLKPRKQW